MDGPSKAILDGLLSSWAKVDGLFGLSSLIFFSLVFYMVIHGVISVM